MTRTALERRLAAADPLSLAAAHELPAGLRERVLARAHADAHAAPVAFKPSRPRRLVPALAAASALGVGIAGAVALLPSAGSDAALPGIRAGLPGPVAAFAAEVERASILHVVTASGGTFDRRGAFTPDAAPERFERWLATDGSASRVVFPGGGAPQVGEIVRKGDEVWSFNVERGLVQRYREPRADSPASPLLALKDGVRGPGLTVVGRTDVRGQDAYEVAFDTDPADGVPQDHVAYVAVDGGALLRVDWRLPRVPGDGADAERVTRTEVYAFDTTERDPAVLEASSRFRDSYDDAPLLPAP